MWRTSRKPLAQFCPTWFHLSALDRDPERLPLPNENDETLASGHARVDEVPGEHCVMLGRDRNHHCRIFRALALVDRGRESGHQGIEFTEGIDDLPALKVDHQRALVIVNSIDHPQIAVEDLSI